MIEKGLLEAARLTTTQRDALSMGSADNGVIFNTTDGQYQAWFGTSWETLAVTGPYAFFQGNGNQENVTASVDLEWANTHNPFNLTRTSTQLTLPKGLWRIDFMLRQTDTWTNDANPWARLYFVDAANNPINYASRCSIMGVRRTTANESGSATMFGLFNVSATQDVKVRVQDSSSGTFRALGRYMMVQRIGL